ncbi:MAG: 4Fe-4S binding protein [Planctomycetes bacterium]|nr:4Fe-4S binding protein [Planctomycetota bacterium]
MVVSSSVSLNPQAELKRIRDTVKRSRGGVREIRVCCGTGCQARGSMELYEVLRKEAESFKGARIRVKKTGCQGLCEKGAVVTDSAAGYFYCLAKKENARTILERVKEDDEKVSSLLYIDHTTGKPVIYTEDIPFYKKQHRLVLRQSGSTDPEDILDYIAAGGYRSLAKVLGGMSPEKVIEEITSSGLRGRGGGGFPTGRKWRSCRDASGQKKYVICNADEGDPGAFMDRSILEGNPHSILEGMIIGAYAIGAHQGYVYVRDEYPLAVHRLKIAMAQAGEFGLLGYDILNTGFTFNVRTNRGGGAFVCGESTALMASLQGQIGEPRAKYIHTVERGLWDCPTVLNNVETWANVPIIIEMGAEQYAKIGSEGSKGTKIFSVVGKVNNTGLVEVPMGMTIREIVFDICGGVRNDKQFKGVQTGGPSGGCIPARLADLPVDFDSLTEAGSMMGSGGMIVLDEHTCMVDVARYFMSFLRKESCGKCTLCREGTEVMHETLKSICEGRGSKQDIDLLEELGQAMQTGALCALGTSAPNSVLSTLRYFQDEYLEHIRNKRCPAGVCRELVTYSIDPDICKGCGKCKELCPQQAIEGEKKTPHRIRLELCMKCGACLDVCPFGAVGRRSYCDKS